VAWSCAKKHIEKTTRSIFLFWRHQDFSKQYFSQALLALKHKNIKLANVSMLYLGATNFVRANTKWW